MANVCFVANSALSHFAVSEDVPVASVLLVGCFVKWLLAHMHLRFRGKEYDVRADKETLLVFACQLFNTPSYLLFMIALGYISIRFAMILENLGPFLVACFSYVFLKERTSALELVNMAVCFAVIVAIVLWKPSEGSVDLYALFIGTVLTLVSLVLFSGTYVINRFLRECDHVVLNALNMLFSLAIAMVLFVCRGGFQLISTHTLGAILWIGALNGVLGFFCSLFFIQAS